MPELRLIAEETRSAGDVLAAWLPRVAVALVFLSVGSEKFGAHGPWMNTGLAAIIPSALLAAIVFVGVRAT